MTVTKDTDLSSVTAETRAPNVMPNVFASFAELETIVGAKLSVERFLRFAYSHSGPHIDDRTGKIQLKSFLNLWQRVSDDYRAECIEGGKLPEKPAIAPVNASSSPSTARTPVSTPVAAKATQSAVAPSLQSSIDAQFPSLRNRQ